MKLRLIDPERLIPDAHVAAEASVRGVEALVIQHLRDKNNATQPNRYGLPKNGNSDLSDAPLTLRKRSTASIFSVVLNTEILSWEYAGRFASHNQAILSSLNLLDLGVDTKKAHARKTRPFQSARRYALRLGDLAILKRPLGCFQPRVENIRLYWIATILDLVGVVNQLRSWRQCLANGDNVAKTAAFQRLGIARRLCSGVVKIGLNIKPNVVLTNLLPALHGSLLPEEKLNPPRMAVTNAAWNRQTPYETGRGYYFHDLPSAAEVRYFLWCHNAKMIPQTTVERQAVHGADLFLYGLHRLLKSMFALNPITKTVAGKIKNKPNNDDWNKLVTEGENKTPKMKQKLIEMEYRFHTESITRKAA